MTRAIPVYLEFGAKRVFAGALEWPGWCRSGKNEEQALATLETYADRYRVVAELAGLEFLAVGEGLEPAVLERLDGDATTDFGAPGAIPTADLAPMAAEDRARTAALMRACWDVLASVAADAPPTMRKGPRGGGRDRDAIVEHVLNAEIAYARRLGCPARTLDASDLSSVRAFRLELADVIAEGSAPPGDPPRSRGGRPPAEPWPPRYAARRIAWHVLDHAWEIEDKSE
ncbi:MAG: hypothetical protein ABSD78_12710 [Acidimicrobiales bacterium]|jgi:hypothetical protein